MKERNKIVTTVSFDKSLLEEVDRRRGKHVDRSGYISMLIEQHFLNAETIELK